MNREGEKKSKREKVREREFNKYELVNKSTYLSYLSVETGECSGMSIALVAASLQVERYGELKTNKKVDKIDNNMKYKIK